MILSVLYIWVLDGSLYSYMVKKKKKRPPWGAQWCLESIIHTICIVVLLEPRGEGDQATGAVRVEVVC